MDAAVKKRILIKAAIAAAAVIIAAVLAVLAVQRHLYLGGLRDEMGGLMADTAIYIERGECGSALSAAKHARELAVELRDADAIGDADAYIVLIGTVARADEHYNDGSYQPALSAYRAALTYASKIEGCDTRYIDERLALAEGHIEFFAMMRRADALAGGEEFEAAQMLYAQAQRLASVLSFSEGQEKAEQGVQHMEEQIALAKWRAEMKEEADGHMALGNLLLLDFDYDGAIGEFQSALEIYSEIESAQDAEHAAERISHAMLLQAQKEAEEARAAAEAAASEADGQAPAGGAGDAGGGAAEGAGDTGGGAGEDDTLYERNLSISFDLSTMIDRQDTGPASQIKMGTAQDRNEGWYNGCGWIATYNMLIKLGSPRHPADIVRYFETIGGTVMGGEFGTYPHAIEDYLTSLGFNARHTLFPGARLSIDDEIKVAGEGILAYLHTSAAHYVMIEYRDSDGRFVVYNDSLARAYSRGLGYPGLSAAGAVIDSVEAWLAQTPQILFTFSLITA